MLFSYDLWPDCQSTSGGLSGIQWLVGEVSCPIGRHPVGVRHKGWNRLAPLWSSRGSPVLLKGQSPSWESQDRLFQIKQPCQPFWPDENQLKRSAHWTIVLKQLTIPHGRGWGCVGPTNWEINWLRTSNIENMFTSLFLYSDWLAVEVLSFFGHFMNLANLYKSWVFVHLQLAWFD